MRFKIILVSICACLSFHSCIQEEALNSEAAIDNCTGSDNVIMTTVTIDTERRMGYIDVYVPKNVDLKEETKKLKFKIPTGATIIPEKDIDEITDFTSQIYTVTSEDKKWSAPYTVKFIQREMPVKYDFETATLSSNKRYFIFSERSKEYIETNGKVEEVILELKWSSGNPGFNLTGVTQIPQEYPTTQEPDGVIGKCLKLETKSTGSFGAVANMPIAAGNLFIGAFDLANALKDAPKATKFGLPFYHEPKAIKGYYKFKPGSELVNEEKDKCDIYAVFYETKKNGDMIDGTHDFKDSDNCTLISIARIPRENQETDVWKDFNFKFDPVSNRSIDPDKLKAGRYKLAVVFSSSREGAIFKGAVGSTLYVDEVEIECK